MRLRFGPKNTRSWLPCGCFARKTIRPPRGNKGVFMISFEPTEDQKLMVESVATFARTTLRPKIRDFERERGVPEAIRNTAAELGLALVALPESVGGAGLGLTTAVLLEEELAWADPAVPFALSG